LIGTALNKGDYSIKFENELMLLEEKIRPGLFHGTKIVCNGKLWGNPYP